MKHDDSYKKQSTNNEWINNIRAIYKEESYIQKGSTHHASHTKIRYNLLNLSLDNASINIIHHMKVDMVADLFCVSSN